MTAVKLNRPVDPMPLEALRYDAQLERRGVVDVNQDGQIDRADGVDPSTLEALRRAADADPAGRPGALDAREVRQLPIKATFGDKLRAFFGVQTVEQTADEVVRQATAGLRDATRSTRALIDDIENYRAAGQRADTHGVEVFGKAMTRDLIGLAERVDATADQLAAAARRDRIGLAGDAEAAEFVGAFHGLLDALTALRAYHLHSDGGWVGPYAAGKLRALPANLEALRAQAQALLGRELPPFKAVVE